MSLIIKKNLKKIAQELGFGDCRVTSVSEAPHSKEFHKWLENNYNGEMKWLEKNPDKRTNPADILPNAKSIIILAFNYYVKNDFRNAEKIKRARFAKYAWGNDYHDELKWRLNDLNEYLLLENGIQKVYTDTGPILERDFASKAGLGWNGKSSVQIHRKLGTWFFLSVILTTLDIEPDRKLGDGCGDCTKCIDSCPTDAIIKPHVLDARRCISYLTIENKGSIPLEFRKAIGDRIYGCDECLEVCPWNRFAKYSTEASLQAREFINFEVRDFLEFSQEQFSKVFSKSPIKRTKLLGLKRNACVVLGNIGDKKDLPSLKKIANSDNQLLAEHANWAIGEIKSRLNET